jgi:hypothetical protein
MILLLLLFWFLPSSYLVSWLMSNLNYLQVQNLNLWDPSFHTKFSVNLSYSCFLLPVLPICYQLRTFPPLVTPLKFTNKLCLGSYIVWNRFIFFVILQFTSSQILSNKKKKKAQTIITRVNFTNTWDIRSGYPVEWKTE